MESLSLYYVAPRESIEFILDKGIFTPNEVNRLIKSGELSCEVLGISYGFKDSSNFPDFVSMVSNVNITHLIAQQICFARTGRYNDPEFMAIGYRIHSDIRKQQGFVRETEVKKMNNDCYPSEVLFKGNLKPEFIHPRYFAVRTN